MNKNHPPNIVGGLIFEFFVSVRARISASPKYVIARTGGNNFSTTAKQGCLAATLLFAFIF